MNEDQDQGRKLAFGRFVRRARDRWLDAHPEEGIREFCDLVGIASPTLYRWINGTWIKDPEKARVTKFATALGIDPRIPRRLLGWTADGVPVRDTTEPELDNDVLAIGRKLADPTVPEAEKTHIRQMLRFLASKKTT